VFNIGVLRSPNAVRNPFLLSSVKTTLEKEHFQANKAFSGVGPTVNLLDQKSNTTYYITKITLSNFPGFINIKDDAGTQLKVYPDPGGASVEKTLDKEPLILKNKIELSIEGIGGGAGWSFNASFIGYVQA
jgi:hypothetical protein